jgi:choline dehydrogenase-like flavoprotein
MLCQLAAARGIWAGGWVRGDSTNYEAWAKLVNDPKRRYEGFLPYFRKTEHYHETAANLKEHGLEGPVHTASVTSSGRTYPLLQQVQEAWATAAVQEPSDARSGSPQGQ